MKEVLIVGSGAAAVHFTAQALENGHRAHVLDVGLEGPATPLPDADVVELRRRHEDPTAYFLGAAFESAVLPGNEELYRLPPSKRHVLEAAELPAPEAVGFRPSLSYARGGLAEAWTAGCYPFSEADLAEFPFELRDLEPYYARVAKHIGVSGSDDDLSPHLPVHEGLLPPLELDPHSRHLLDRYHRRRDRVRALGAVLGRSRVAVTGEDRGDRQGCTYLGRCLWGCPRGSIYTPAQTLAECRVQPSFRYTPGYRALYFELDGQDRIAGLVATELATGAQRRFEADAYALGAGTLGSTEIFLRTIARRSGERLRLTGLMDNRQVLAPFLTPALVGVAGDRPAYQFHLLGLGAHLPDGEYLHAQITTLTNGLHHSVAQRLPLPMPAALRAVQTLAVALGVVNLNFADRRREESWIELQPDLARLRIHYRPADGDLQRRRLGVRLVRRALRALGSWAPRSQILVRPPGSSVHYAGSLPMSREDRPWTTTPDCRSRDIPDLYLLDGATFPALPAKNITFTLMANARRVADLALPQTPAAGG